MLPIQWTAVYEDGTRFNQYNKDGSENFYRDVDHSKLFSFEYYDIKNGITYNLNLRYGNFSINGVSIIWFNGDPDFRDYRLIFFRRVRVIIGVFGGAAKPKNITYYLGWQATVNGRNKKRLVKITDKGEFVIEE